MLLLSPCRSAPLPLENSTYPPTVANGLEGRFYMPKSSPLTRPRGGPLEPLARCVLAITDSRRSLSKRSELDYS
eukprot:1181825-Prorocentrum_minimum.AAC.6